MKKKIYTYIIKMVNKVMIVDLDTFRSGNEIAIKQKSVLLEALADEKKVIKDIKIQGMNLIIEYYTESDTVSDTVSDTGCADTLCPATTVSKTDSGGQGLALNYYKSDGSGVSNLSTATGTGSFASGDNCIASNTNSLAIGKNCVSKGLQGVSLGLNCKAEGDYSVSLGSGNKSNAVASFTAGGACKADGSSSISMGDTCISSGKSSIAMGRTCKADGASSIAMGDTCTAIGVNSIAMGVSCTSKDSYGISLGTNCTSTASYNGVAIGSNCNSGGNHSVAMGSNNTSHGADSTCLGEMNYTHNEGEFACGYNNLSGSQPGVLPYQMFSVGGGMKGIIKGTNLFGVGWGVDSGNPYKAIDSDKDNDIKTKGSTWFSFMQDGEMYYMYPTIDSKGVSWIGGALNSTKPQQ